MAKKNQSARHAVGERRAVDGPGDADDGGDAVRKRGILRQRLQRVDRAFGVGHQDQGFSRRQRHDRVTDDIGVGVAALPSPCLDVAGRITLRLEVGGGVREHIRQIGDAFGEQPGHRHHPRARRDVADDHRSAGRRRFASQTPERGAVLAWPVVRQGGPVIAADRAVDFSEPAPAIGDAGLRVRQQRCGFGVFQRRRRAAASGEHQRNRGEQGAPARPYLERLPRCRTASGFAANRIGIRRYLVAPTAARRDPRALKHLKHETSTKHQCAVTASLEMTGHGAAHTGLASNSGFVNERA